MASPDLIRKALLALMGAKKDNQAAQKPLRTLEQDSSSNVTGRGQYVDPDEQLRHLRGEVNRMASRGEDEAGRLNRLDVEAERADQEARYAKGEQRLRNDPMKQAVEFEVPGSNEALTLFESLMDDIAGLSTPDPEDLARLKRIDPEWWEIVMKEYQEAQADKLFSGDELPF